MSAVELVWRNRTKCLGFVQVTMAVLASQTALIPADVLPVMVLINGLLTAWVGFFNSSLKE